MDTQSLGTRGPFVLVHGGWHGGWCWSRVLPRLCAGGRDAYCPTLTGLGERSHLLTRAVSRDTHVRDVVAALEYEDLQDVTLVVHSYAGMLAPDVTVQAAGRVAVVVYLDAYLPHAGRSCHDYLPPKTVAMLEQLTNGQGEGWRTPPPPLEDLGVTDAGDLAWATPRLTPHPARTILEPSTNGAEGRPQDVYVRVSDWPQVVEAAERAARYGMAVHQLTEAGHDAMITRPAELAGLLLAVG